MKSSQILLLLTALLTTEARHSPKSSLTTLPAKHHRRAFVNKPATAVPAQNDAARSVRGGGGGEATMTNEMFNMVKAVVGVGVLSLPAGKFDMSVDCRCHHDVLYVDMLIH